MQTSLMQRQCRVAHTTRATFSSSSAINRPFRNTSAPRPDVSCEAASLQFIRGVEEPTVPEVQISKSRSGDGGSALFVFQEPAIFQAAAEMGDITGLYLDDDEGTLTTVNVKATFINQRPTTIEARYTMKSEMEFDRFMRFMDRYSEAKGLGFEKGSEPAEQ